MRTTAACMSRPAQFSVAGWPACAAVTIVENIQSFWTMQNINYVQLCIRDSSTGKRWTSLGRENAALHVVGLGKGLHKSSVSTVCTPTRLHEDSSVSRLLTILSHCVNVYY